MSRQLPPNPSIEQLKKQAKDLCKARQAADPEAVERIRQQLPKFADTPAEEVQNADISLQDCQHVIAREYGFASWNWLRAVVEIDMELLAGITDREAQTFMRETDQKDLVIGLKSAADESEQVYNPSEGVLEKFLGNMSDRVRQFITEEMEFLGPMPLSEVRDVQRRMLRLAADLAARGQISYPNGGSRPQPVEPEKSFDDFTPRLVELAGTPLEELSFEEIVELIGEIARRARDLGILSLEPLDARIASPFVREALRLVIDGTEPPLIEDILNTRIEQAIIHRQKARGSMVLEGMTALCAGDNPRIIHHKLSTFYQTEMSESGAGDWEASAEDLLARMRATPFGQLEFEQINALITDMANLARRWGLKALSPLIEVADYPLLKRGLELLCAERNMGTIVETLEQMQQEELAQLETRHRMIVVGIISTQAGKKPDEIEQLVRQTAEAK